MSVVLSCLLSYLALCPIPCLRLRSFRLRLCHDWEFITAPEGHAQYYLEDHLGDDNSVIIDHLYKGIILGNFYLLNV